MGVERFPPLPDNLKLLNLFEGFFFTDSIPCDSSPFFTTILGNIFVIVAQLSNHQT